MKYAGLPDVGATTSYGKVVAVEPPNHYIAADQLYGGQPKVVQLHLGGITTVDPLDGVLRSRAGVVYWVRRSEQGRWYVQILAGGRWHYVGQRPFGNLVGCERLTGRPWCRGCRVSLTDVTDLRAGRCAMCAFIAEHGPPRREQIREVACPECGVGPGEVCREDGGDRERNHAARRDACIAVQMVNAPRQPDVHRGKRHLSVIEGGRR